MAEKIPLRFHWALEQLDVRPDEHLLEIGSGPGVLLAMVAHKLTSGTITGLDRSDTATARTAARSAGAIANGKVKTVTAPFADAPFEPASFDRIFAFNVNVFWMQPRAELAMARRLLKPGGALVLFYDPPGAAQVAGIVDRLRTNLAAGGFAVRGVANATVGTTAVVAVTATPAE